MTDITARPLVVTLPDSNLELGAYVVGGRHLCIYLNTIDGPSIARIMVENMLPVDPYTPIGDVRLIPDRNHTSRGR